MHLATKLLFAATVAGAISVVPPGGPAQADNCAFSAAQARQLISQQGLMSAGEAKRIAASRGGGRAFYVKLCRSGNQYYYSVNVMQGGKKLTTVTVNARR